MSSRFTAAELLVAACVAIGIVLLIVTVSPYDPRDLEELSLPKGRILVEVASTPEERANGLTNRDMVADGLLLDWKDTGRHPIWMADMRFALDLVWIDGLGHVLSVLSNVPPCNTQPCKLYEPPHTERSHAVLELPAGNAAKYGITVGALIRTADGASRNSR